MKYKLSKYLHLLSRELTFNSCYYTCVFSCRSGMLFMIKSNDWQKIQDTDYSILTEEQRKTLIEKKVLVPETENEFEVLIKENIEYRDKEQDLLYISVQPTARCQLACRYCGQEHETANMDVATMDLAIARIISKIRKNHKRLIISWFGGEPLLTLDEMGRLTTILQDYCKQKGIQYSAKIVTNGIRLVPETYRKLVDEWNISNVEITLDGLAEAHDQRRKYKNGRGSFDTIYGNLLRILDTKTENTCTIGVRCNVDRFNRASVIPFIRKMDADGVLQRISYYYIAIVRSWAQNNADKDFTMEEFANLEIDVLMERLRLQQDRVQILPNRHYQSCIATDNEAEMYDAYGNVFDCAETSYAKCYKESGLYLGKIQDADLSGRSALHDNFKNLLKGNYTECSNCAIFPLCMGGCPKSLLEKKYPCPSYKYNLDDRMLLYCLYSNMDKKDFIENINLAIP